MSTLRQKTTLQPTTGGGSSARLWRRTSTGRAQGRRRRGSRRRRARTSAAAARATGRAARARRTGRSRVRARARSDRSVATTRPAGPARPAASPATRPPGRTEQPALHSTTGSGSSGSTVAASPVELAGVAEEGGLLHGQLVVERLAQRGRRRAAGASSVRSSSPGERRSDRAAARRRAHDGVELQAGPLGGRARRRRRAGSRAHRAPATSARTAVAICSSGSTCSAAPELDGDLRHAAHGARRLVLRDRPAAGGAQRQQPRARRRVPCR